MSKSISFRDLQLATVLKELNELQMIHPSNDEKMKWVMSQCGIDVEYDIEYIPCLHRDMRNKVAVGFIASGELNINRHVLNSVVCDVTDRLVAAGMQDPSLAKELAGMLSSRADYRHLNEDTDAVDIDEEDGRGKSVDEDVEESYEFVSLQIRQLEMLRDEIRGVVKK